MDLERFKQPPVPAWKNNLRRWLGPVARLFPFLWRHGKVRIIRHWMTESAIKGSEDYMKFAVGGWEPFMENVLVSPPAVVGGKVRVQVMTHFRKRGESMLVEEGE